MVIIAATMEITNNHAMNLADPARPFARTNPQTIRQRAGLLRELLLREPLARVKSLAEICCGDCQAQYEIYHRELNLNRFDSLDLSPTIVAFNRSRGIPCRLGSALNPQVLRPFLDCDVLFFGPPLSVDCDGHHLLSFRQVTPGYAEFCRLLLGELGYTGLLVCIGPRATTPGDAQWLLAQIRAYRPDMGLRQLHYSQATLTGDGQPTEMRLKYVELWLSSTLGDLWEQRTSYGDPQAG